MDKSILHRIEALEDRAKNEIIVACTNIETGEERTMSIRDLIPDFEKWQLIRVVKGHDLSDLDAYLAAFRNYVELQEDQGQ